MSVIHGVCLPPPLPRSSRFKCDRGELRGASALSFAAVSNVGGFVPKLHGAPTKRHQVRTVVVCSFFFFFFLIIARDAF